MSGINGDGRKRVLLCVYTGRAIPKDKKIRMYVNYKRNCCKYAC